MADEGMDTAKILVRALIVIGIIGIVFGLYMLMSGKLSATTNKLSDNLNSLDSSTYASYDDADVTGNEVLTALKTFRDADFAVVVYTKAKGISMDNFGTTDLTEKTGVNYCALLVGADKDSTLNSPALKAGTNGYEISKLDWDDTSGHCKRNTNFSPTQLQGETSTFIQQKAKFRGKLIYDENDAAVGVVFLQYGGGGSGS